MRMVRVQHHEHQAGHGGGLGNIDRVASGDLDNRRPGTPGHEALGGRGDHPVVLAPDDHGPGADT